MPNSCADPIEITGIGHAKEQVLYRIHPWWARRMVEYNEIHQWRWETMVENEGMSASARLKLALFHAIMLVITDGRVPRSCHTHTVGRHALWHCIHTDCQDDVKQKTPTDNQGVRSLVLISVVVCTYSLGNCQSLIQTVDSLLEQTTRRRRLSYGCLNVEKSYLKSLPVKHIPRRARRVFSGVNSATEVIRISFLLALIVSVGIGFLCGYVKQA